MERDKVGDVRSEQSWSFLGGVWPVQEEPRNNGWLVHFSTCCSLWLYKNTQRRCLLWVKHSKSFPPCLFIRGQGNTLNPLRVRWGWLACSAYLAPDSMWATIKANSKGEESVSIISTFMNLWIVMCVECEHFWHNARHSNVKLDSDLDKTIPKEIPAKYPSSHLFW